MSAASVALVDLGMGNLRSVERALGRAAEDAGAPCVVTRTSDPEVVARADKVVVPGQGAFRDCARALAGGLGEALRGQITRGTPYLGICLGLQALFEESEEAPGERGMGMLAGRVVRLECVRDADKGIAAKVPHMGWNRVTLVREIGEVGAALGTLDGGVYLYFVHSYQALPADAAVVAAIAEHGGRPVVAAIERDNVVATQFHPEKSQAAGLRFLAGFLAV